MLSTGEIFFTITYIFLLSVIILNLPFFKKFQIPARFIVAIFICKVLTGILYGLIHFYFYEGGDTFAYFHDSQVIRSSLTADPSIFLKLVFGVNTRPPAPDIISYARSMSYWNDMGSYFIVRFHTLAGLITGHHYYANVVIYNFLTLIGMLYLFEFINELLPGKKYLIAGVLFLFPSVSFWASGIHKDGISVAAAGIMIYCTHQLIIQNKLRRSKKPPYKILIALLIATWILFVVRTYLLMLLIPCLISFAWISISPGKAILKFAAVIISFYFLVFQLHWITPQLDLLKLMTEQQQEFAQSAAGNTSFTLSAINNQFASFRKLIPEALANSLVHPAPWEISSFLQLTSSIDNIILWLLVILAIIFFRKSNKNNRELFLFSAFFALSIFIFTGSIVPNAGALVRYKMPGTIFLVIGCFTAIDYSRLKRVFGLTSG